MTSARILFVCLFVCLFVDCLFVCFYHSGKATLFCSVCVEQFGFGFASLPLTLHIKFVDFLFNFHHLYLIDNFLFYCLFVCFCLLDLFLFLFCFFRRKLLSKFTWATIPNVGSVAWVVRKKKRKGGKMIGQNHKEKHIISRTRRFYTVLNPL